MPIYPDASREIVCHILNLFPTIDEALQHQLIQLSELRLEESGVLFYDTAEAISKIAGVLPLLLPQAPTGYLVNLTENIISAMRQIVEAYEMGELLTIQTVLVRQFIPDVESWQRELEEMLRPLFSS